jgi:hypothetical protein
MEYGIFMVQCFNLGNSRYSETTGVTRVTLGVLDLVSFGSARASYEGFLANSAEFFTTNIKYLLKWLCCLSWGSTGIPEENWLSRRRLSLYSPRKFRDVIKETASWRNEETVNEGRSRLSQLAKKWSICTDSFPLLTAWVALWRAQIWTLIHVSIVEFLIATRLIVSLESSASVQRRKWEVWNRTAVPDAASWQSSTDAKTNWRWAVFDQQFVTPRYAYRKCKDTHLSLSWCCEMRSGERAAVGSCPGCKQPNVTYTDESGQWNAIIEVRRTRQYVLRNVGWNSDTGTKPQKTLIIMKRNVLSLK